MSVAQYIGVVLVPYSHPATYAIVVVQHFNDIYEQYILIMSKNIMFSPKKTMYPDQANVIISVKLISSGNNYEYD